MAFSFFKKNKEEKKDTSSSLHYYALEVSEIVNETKDAISISFKQPDTKIDYKSGQFLTLIVPVKGKEVRRAYSLCSSPFTDSDLTVAVKRVDNGVMSNWLPDNLKVGDAIRIMEPMGVFTTDIASDKIVSDNPIHQRLLKAYYAAQPYIKGDLLELGCGEGRGVELLAPLAKSYQAMDKIQGVIDELNQQYPTLTFKQGVFPPYK